MKKETYTSPESKVVQMEMKKTILDMSQGGEW